MKSLLVVEIHHIKLSGNQDDAGSATILHAFIHSVKLATVLILYTLNDEDAHSLTK